MLRIDRASRKAEKTLRYDAMLILMHLYCRMVEKLTKRRSDGYKEAVWRMFRKEDAFPSAAPGAPARLHR
jgi:hypothetical protein